MKPLWLRLTSHDPAYNLALEEQLFLSLPKGHPGLFLLWQNGPSIIVGRHQCTAEEVSVPFVEACGVPVVRRITGGGAVYHDLGNLNFSFIEHAGKTRVDFAHYLAPICHALADMGVHARISGRNDLEVQGRKISGSGQYLRHGRTLHHGTLLVQADFSRMAGALTPNAEKLQSRGVASVEARVANISQFWSAGSTLQALEQALVAHCAGNAGGLPPADEVAARKLAQEKYRTWEWNYGASPDFDEERRQRFPFGSVCLRYSLHKGAITACRIHGDFFSTQDIASLEAKLVGLCREPDKLYAKLADIPWQEYFCGCDAQEVRCFFAGRAAL